MGAKGAMIVFRSHAPGVDADAIVDRDRRRRTVGAPTRFRSTLPIFRHAQPDGDARIDA
jgi:hypothetical protein